MTVTDRTELPADRHTRRRLFDADQGALRELFELHADSVFSVALRVTHDRQASGEITRRVFAQLWRGRATLPSEFRANMSTCKWLRTAARAEGLAWRNGHHEPECDARNGDAEPPLPHPSRARRGPTRKRER